jgi:hypothetical protein
LSFLKFQKSEGASSVTQKSAGAEKMPLVGDWNNCDFTKPPAQWSADARNFGGDHGIVDLVVTQAHANKLASISL